MRTSIVIDDKLLREAQQATGLKTKRETVELALQTQVRLNHQAQLRALRGKVAWDGDLHEMRLDR